MHKKIIISTILCGMLSPFLVPFCAHAEQQFMFTQDLNIGSKSAEVRELQIMLNKDPETQITSMGIGSPGHETTFFGSKTKRAVIRFQNKYKDTVLIPNHLSYGTGRVGAATRAKLNSFSNSQIGSVTFHPLDQISATVSAAKKNSRLEFRLFNVAPKQVRPGDTITLTGNNFGNDVLMLHVGDSVVVPIVGNSATLPGSLSLGGYNLYVTGPKGSTKNDAFPVTLIVTDATQPAPHVDSVNPRVVSSTKQVITITGSYFSRDTTIATYFGTVHVASNDGTTISFALADLSDQSLLQTMYAKKPVGLNLSVPFVISTAAGVSGSDHAFVVQ
jgi:peptidoglycan hydrolase-like protein with peptidoglycan-binding domain